MNLIELLSWRYAIKSITGLIVPQEKVKATLNATLICSTSSELQPFQVILKSKSELKKKTITIATNQLVVLSFAHLKVFDAWNIYTKESANNHFSYLNKQKIMPASITDSYRIYMLDIFSKQKPLEHFNHESKQSFIGLGFALKAAANEKINSTTMEGFDTDALDKILILKKRGLKSTSIFALGHRDVQKDRFVKSKKVRESVGEFITLIKQ